ncbi:MAG: flagellar motor switch phosphatase FliY [Clostridiaceae bacterium]|nr:flagellar motor switch phosphatase FliY [Clostridiaceae bacterium]
MSKELSAIDNNQSLTLDEKDTIGEILNISMGASATAVSVLVNRKVNITTPKVNVVVAGAFEYEELEPAIGIEIEYIEGLYGSNIMIMSVKDVKKLVGLLIEDEGMQDDDSELDEMHISALGEIMNQMMGASSTALASMLNSPINISPPKTFDLSQMGKKLPSIQQDDHVVAVSFRLQVEGLIDSEVITVMPIDFTRELVMHTAAIGSSENDAADTADEQSDISDILGYSKAPAVAYMENFQEEPEKKPDPKPSAKQPESTPSPMAERAHAAKNVNVVPLQFSSIENETLGDKQVDFGLVKDVELVVTVEIGRKKQRLKEILEFRQGSVIELDKQAGDPVDVLVNGQLIARGDVVVIDDNFGVRITEIVSRGK